MKKTQAVIVDKDGTLACPRCGDVYLHHEGVSIFSRREDDYWATVITQEGDTVTTNRFPNADTCNPSPRRHGMIIKFRCEHCEDRGGETSLQFALLQHKGVTYMHWVGW